MIKKIVFSAKMDHDIIKEIVPSLNRLKNIDLVLHDPTKDFFNLEELPKKFGNVDYFIVKVGSECSIDLLHFAKLYNIPTLHDIDVVLLCKNKVALDHALRKVFREHYSDLENFFLPKSWTQSLLNVDKFKEWALHRLPIVIKSHYQHDKYMRFNFLVKKIEEIDDFIKKFNQFLYYDVYIQEFIECDGIDRKIYVIGDKIFGIKRENPIYLYLREKPDSIDVDTIRRENFTVSNDIKKLARILSKELKLKIFGFDLIKPINKNQYYLIDLNDFPGFKGIRDLDNVFVDFIKNYLEL
ncbi:MAG: ATP-grasp domain-containing protein [Promethearchaeota archaeon]